MGTVPMAATTGGRRRASPAGATAAVVTANAYYIHPIIALVADDFGVSASEIGLVPALNQIALAFGIFLLLPLGDRFSNRTLATIFAAGQFVGMAAMAFATDFRVFVAGSTLSQVTAAPVATSTAGSVSFRSGSGAAGAGAGAGAGGWTGSAGGAGG